MMDMLGKLGNSYLGNKIFTVIFLLFSTAGFATNYYVSSTGNDASAGTSIAGAWATIQKVNTITFLPGDALYFEGGHRFNGSIYLENTDANDASNIFIISSYGTGRATINAGSSYGFYAYNTGGISISNLIFDGNDVSTNTREGIMFYSDLTGNVKFRNISVTNTEVKNFGAEGVKIFTSDQLTGYQNVELTGLSVHDVTKNGIVVFGYLSQSLVGWAHKNVTVSNCEVYNVPGSPVPVVLEGSGIVLEGVDGGIIQHCVAHDNGQNNVFCGGPAGIWTLESNDIRIQYCESYRNHTRPNPACDGIGFDLDGGVTNSIMQYNYSHDNDGAGYLLGQYENARPWSNNTMRYNISVNDGVTNEGGIGVFKGPNSTMDGAYIYNNTIYVSPQAVNSRESAAYLENWSPGITNVNFYNNIFITTGGVPLVIVPPGYSAFFAGNIYWPSGGAFSISYQGTSYSSLDAWRTATGNERVGLMNTGFNGDPLLSNTGYDGTVGFGNSLTSLNAYKINSPSSPATNAALDLSALYSINPGGIDFWETILPGGSSNDIGANQLSSSLPVKLAGFYGSCSGSEQKITWSTAEETNMKSFEIMYSGDGITFNRLTDINPRGSNSVYSFINDLTSPGNNYYQLRMTDLDGTVSYSPILKIKCEGLKDKTTVWPNPFSQSVYISIESSSSGWTTLALYDPVGKMLSQKKVQIQEGINKIKFEGMGDLPAGSYYLHIIHPDKLEHFKLIKTGH